MYLCVREREVYAHVCVREEERFMHMCVYMHMCMRERERETESKSVITLYPSSEEIHNAGKF